MVINQLVNKYLMSSENINKRILHMPLIKSNSGDYLAILSDDSIDRDGEIVSKQFLSKCVTGEIKIPALMDHENKMLNMVGEWVDKKITKVNGHNAFVARPKWYLSNPNAKIIKGMLDEGAQVGVSIGAIVHKFSDVTIKGKSYRQFDEGEILEASFTPVSANKHAMAMAIAKSLKSKEALEMSESDIEKNKFDELSKSFEALKEENAALKSEIVELKKSEDKPDEEEEKKACKSEEEKKSMELTVESVNALIEKKVAEATENLSKTYETKMNDRFTQLKEIKKNDDIMVEKNLEVGKNMNKEIKPSTENLIAVQKGWNIE